MILIRPYTENHTESKKRRYQPVVYLWDSTKTTHRQSIDHIPKMATVSQSLSLHVSPDAVKGIINPCHIDPHKVPDAEEASVLTYLSFCNLTISVIDGVKGSHAGTSKDPTTTFVVKMWILYTMPCIILPWL